MGTSGMSGLGVLLKKGGGSYAGQVTSLYYLIQEGGRRFCGSGNLPVLSDTRRGEALLRVR